MFRCLDTTYRNRCDYIQVKTMNNFFSEHAKILDLVLRFVSASHSSYVEYSIVEYWFAVVIWYIFDVYSWLSFSSFFDFWLHRLFLRGNHDVWVCLFFAFVRKPSWACIANHNAVFSFFHITFHFDIQLFYQIFRDKYRSGLRRLPLMVMWKLIAGKLNSENWKQLKLKTWKLKVTKIITDETCKRRILTFVWRNYSKNI